MLSHEIITLSSSATSQIHPSASALPPYSEGVTISVQNLSGSSYVYLGADTSSSTSYGFRLSPNQSISYDLNPFDNLHAIGGNGGVQVAVTRLFW